MTTLRRRDSISHSAGSGSGSGSAGEGDDFMHERQALDMNGLPFYTYFKGDTHTKLIEELRREKDILVRKLSKTNPDDARKIKQELVHAGILDQDLDEGDDGGNHALMLLQLTGFSSSSPSSSPISSSPIGASSYSSTPPLNSYADTYGPVHPPVISSGPRAHSPLSMNHMISPPSSSSLAGPASFGSLASSATAFINASSSSPAVPQKTESAFLTFNPIVTTITSPHSVTTSTIIPSMTSQACSSDLLGSKKKRQRTNPEQLQILEQIFETEKMPSQQVRQQLAEQLGMSTRRIQIWFQNKRAKVKRHPGSGASLSGNVLNKSLDDGSSDDEEEDAGSDGHVPSPSPLRVSSTPPVHIHSASISMTGRGGAGAPMFVPRAAIST